jgi:hypothetical protein
VSNSAAVGCTSNAPAVRTVCNLGIDCIAEFEDFLSCIEDAPSDAWSCDESDDHASLDAAECEDADAALNECLGG